MAASIRTLIPALIRALGEDEPVPVVAPVVAPVATRPAPKPIPTPRPVASKRQKVERKDDTVASNGPDIRTLDQLLDAAKVDRSVWRVTTWRSNTWAGNWQVRANLERIPEFLTCVDEVTIRREHRPPRGKGEPYRVACFGDLHAGYEWDFRDRELIPWHDLDAAELAIEWFTREQPDAIMLMGDLLDFAPLSTKFKRAPECRYTLQPTFVWLHGWLVRLRKACPSARIVYLEGNHEERMRNYLIEKADELLGIADVETGETVNSIPSRLKLDAIDIEYRHEVCIDGVWYRHAGMVKQGGGATAAANVAKAQAHTVTGHIHREELAWKNVTRPDGSRGRVLAMSIPCACHVDGRVAQAGKTAPDWQTGVGQVTTWGEGGDVCPEFGTIIDGALLWRGVRYETA